MLVSRKRFVVSSEVRGRGEAGDSMTPDQLFLCGQAEKIAGLVHEYAAKGYVITQSSITVAAGTEQMYVLIIMERR